MQIIDYKYLYGTEHRDGYIAIPSLNRIKPATAQFIRLANLDVTLRRPTAFFYIDGVSISPSESGLNDTPREPNFFPVVKSPAGVVIHQWVRTFKNRELITEVDIMSGTCAAGIQAIARASEYLFKHPDHEVIIIGGERITPDTLRLFRELNIPVTCGDGFVYMRLEAGSQISDINWLYKFNANPFQFTSEDMANLVPEYSVDFVKPHGTGTKANTEAEKPLTDLAPNIVYKDRIGHTQGVSALLETCMLLDTEHVNGTILVTANGLGGFYGSFTVDK
jgi:hypothetical protein